MGTHAGMMEDDEQGKKAFLLLCGVCYLGSTMNRVAKDRKMQSRKKG
jgi:hypothetical protein